MALVSRAPGSRRGAATAKLHKAEFRVWGFRSLGFRGSELRV